MRTRIPYALACAAVLAATAARAEPFDAALLRLPDGGLVMQVRGLGDADPAGVRMLFDVDHRAAGLAGTSADFMIEGGVAFRYPKNGTGWNWDEMCGAASVVGRDGTASYLLPECVRGPTIRWAVEVLDSSWNPVRRVPVEGMRETAPDSAPDLGPGPAGPVPAVATNLAAAVRPSLSVRYRGEANREAWAAAPTGAPPPGVSLPGGARVPVTLRLFDPAGGGRTALAPERESRSGAKIRWEGRAAGLAWSAVFEPATNGDLRVTGEVESPSDRCVRIEAVATPPPGEWTWHDGIDAARLLSGGTGLVSFAAASGFGARGLQSLLPFGLVSAPAGTLSVECDPDEPRIFEICAEKPTGALLIAFDLGLTPMTSKFPGRATFSAVFSAGPRPEEDPFRIRLGAWHRARGRTPDGAFVQWLPPGASADGVRAFAAGPVAMELDEPGAAEVPPGGVGYGRLQPWDVVIPWPPREHAGPAGVLRMLYFLAATDGPHAFFARAALVAGARDAAGEIVHTGRALAGGAVRVHLAASADPDFMTTHDLPVNPAAAQAGRSAAFVESGAGGIVVAGLPGLRGLDFNRAALAAADLPCSFAPGELKPGLAAPVAACEFLLPLAAALHAQGRRLALSVEGELHPALAAAADVVVARGPPADGAAQRAVRWLCGPAPYAEVRAGDFSWEDSSRLDRGLRDAMIDGAVASPGADADGVPYWSKPEYAARDRAALGVGLPVLHRLAAAGWRAADAPAVRGAAVRAEAFGAPEAPVRHYVLANTSDLPVLAEIQVRAASNPTIVVDALSGGCDLLPAAGGGPVRVGLPGGGVAVLDVVSPAGRAEEKAFLGAWASPGGESAAALRNLASLEAEQAARAPAWTSRPEPAVRGTANELALRVVNAGDGPMVLSGVQLRAGGKIRPVGAEPRILGAGEAHELRTTFSEEETGGGWAALEWKVQRGTQEWACARAMRPRYVEAVDAAPPADEWRSITPVAALPVLLRNNSRQAQEVAVSWDGDFGRGRQVSALAPGTKREIMVTLAGETGKRGMVRLAIEAAGRTGYRGEHRVVFLPAGASLARDSRVRVEADSELPGRPASSAVDGIGAGGGEEAAPEGWSSDAGPGEHWLRIAWPSPQSVANVTLVWPAAGGHPAPGRPGVVLGWTAGGEEIELAAYQPGADEAATKISFEPALLRAVEIRQRASADASALPQAFQLSEVEIR